MVLNKKRKHVRASGGPRKLVRGWRFVWGGGGRRIAFHGTTTGSSYYDSYEFETFVRTHLPADLADIILLTIGIKSYNGFVQYHDLNAELLDVYDSLNEKEKLNLFLYHNASSTTRVKPAILRELKNFQDECWKRIDNDKNNEIGSGADLFNKN
jgi:hypothetical protein